VSADWVIEQIRYARNRLDFVILDACRNNPFARSFRSADRGLARMDAPAGVLIAYSTAPGDVAADGDGGNSPYSAALAETMRASDQPAELMFKQARDTVRRVTADRQTPWESSSLTGQNFYFRRALSVAAGSPVSEPTAPPSSAGAPATMPVGAAPAAASVTPPSPALSGRDTPAPETSKLSPGQPASPAAEVGAARPKGSEEHDLDAFMNGRPLFMSDPVCSRAVGQWRVDGDSMQALVRLDANAGGVARIEGHAQPVKVTWQCNGSDFTFKFDGNVVHKVRIDAEEKLLFGYDQAGVPVTYTR
jgi:Caspase domain